jgi:hypothetical protein
MGQQLLDVVLRRHLDKFSCTVESGTELRSFEQSDEGITAVLARNDILETVHIKWMIGADGAKGMRLGLIERLTNTELTGVVRKQLGLTFLGETRDDTHIVIADIRLSGVGLDREVSTFTIRWELDSDPVSKHWHRFGSPATRM